MLFTSFCSFSLESKGMHTQICFKAQKSFGSLVQYLVFGISLCVQKTLSWVKVQNFQNPDFSKFQS